MKRIVMVSGGLLVLLPLALLLLMRFWVVPQEGYPTWEAVRNILIQDGEIVITLPDGVTLLEARCDGSRDDLTVEGQVVRTKIGYGLCTISLDVEIGGRRQRLCFHSQKLNDWNRIRFEPLDSQDPFSDYAKFENGLGKSHHDFNRKEISEAGAR